MSYAEQAEADKAALEARLLRLRAFAEDIAQRLHDMPAPQTHIEAARAQRCALTMQALLRQLYTTPYPSEPRRYEDKDFPILFRDWDDATGRDDRLPSDPDFRIENINCIPLPGEEDRDIWEIIAATQDEQQDFDIAEDCGGRPGGAPYDSKDRFSNCPRLQLWIQTYGMDYFAPEPP